MVKTCLTTVTYMYMHEHVLWIFARYSDDFKHVTVVFDQNRNKEALLISAQ